MAGGKARTETLGAKLHVASLLGDVAEARHRAALATRACSRFRVYLFVYFYLFINSHV